MFTSGHAPAPENEPFRKRAQLAEFDVRLGIQRRYGCGGIVRRDRLLQEDLQFGFVALKVIFEELTQSHTPDLVARHSRLIAGNARFLYAA